MKKDVFEKLQKVKEQFSNEIDKIGVFGSYAREEETKTSDIDLLVTLKNQIGLFKFVRLQKDIEETLNLKVDLVTPQALHPALKNKILSEVIYV
jgi:predicted nucleotidyltransferase